MTARPSSRFKKTFALQPGYSITDVEDLIARIEATLGRGWHAQGPVTAAEIRRAQLRTVRLRTGYHPDEVDAALDRYEAELRRAEAG